MAPLATWLGPLKPEGRSVWVTQNEPNLVQWQQTKPNRTATHQTELHLQPALEKGQSNCRLAQITIFKLSSKFLWAFVGFPLVFCFLYFNAYTQIAVFFLDVCFISSIQKMTCCALVNSVYTPCERKSEQDVRAETQIEQQCDAKKSNILCYRYMWHSR